MKEELQAYLEQVMRHSGLSKREKADWVEEMSSHLQDETHRLMECGYAEDKAVRGALNNFGKPSTLRKKIARETFGCSVATILGLSLLCLVWFIVDLYILQAHLGSQYRRYPHMWQYVVRIASTIPVSPSLALGTCISLLTLFKTRSRRDRFGLVLTLDLFGLLWILERVPLSSQVNTFVFGFRSLWEGGLGGSYTICGVLVLWGLSLYLLTNNQWVSVVPTIISTTVSIWIPIFIYVHNSLVQATWDGRVLLHMCLLVGLRCLPILVLLVLFKVIRHHRDRQRSLASY